jgi:D-galactarolactone cycloisomerase
VPLALEPIGPMLELDPSSHAFRQDLIHGAIKMEGGMAWVPDGPGIGVGVKRGVIGRGRHAQRGQRA